jgi:NAD(P)-dependent dehydrogenase (short-subunit alcohol dehydrogenase family)
MALATNDERAPFDGPWEEFNMALLGCAPRYTVRGKTFLITGGSRGLGLIMARQLVADGARVAVCARDTRELKLARADLEGRGGDVFAVVADAGEEAEAVGFVREAYAHFGAIHGLINNAGVTQVGPFPNTRADDYELSLRTHFWAPFFMITETLPYLKARGSDARILNVCSIGGKLAKPHMIPYSVGKFALAALSEGLRAELAPLGIAVTSAYPGLMRTGSVRQALVKGDKPREFAWFAVAEAMPLLSMDAERAARRILLAMRRGESEITLTAPAWIAGRAHALFPEMTAWISGKIASLMPTSDPFDASTVRGADLPTPDFPSRWARVTEKAARRNNELVH